MKRYLLHFGIFLMMLIPAVLFAQESGKIQKVVIDAGHGGKDPGALGKNIKEKDIALSIALKTGNYIEKNFPDVEVIYTRKTDKFIELHERAKIANENEADLFISIHCNANTNSRIYGSETYVMGLHRSQANLEVAKLENAAILKEENYEDQYEGFDPNSDVAYILFSLVQSENSDLSLNFAAKVQDQFRERVGLKDRSVMQAGFLVLYKTTMPSVLIETGYLSNQKDASFLASEEGQVYIASAIYRAFKEYKLDLERDNSNPMVNPAAPAPDVTNSEESDKNNLWYRVQFMIALTEKQLNTEEFKNLPDVFQYRHQNYYKYTAGKFAKFADADKFLANLQARGYKDAFVVAFLDNERISVYEAKKLSGE